LGNSDSWDGLAKIQVSLAPVSLPELAPADVGRVTIARAIQAFTSEFQEHAAQNTQKKYRLLLNKLKAFSETRGYIMLEQ
jgi:hypothetical protein